VTPFGSSGFVSWPYSVIQNVRFFFLNHSATDFSNRGIWARVTFGQRTFESGLPLIEVG
jgi:hypothetical protein